MTFEVDMVVRYFAAALSRCGIYLDTVELTPEGTGTDKVNCTWFPDSTDPTVCVDEPPTTVSPPHGECSSPSLLPPLSRDDVHRLSQDNYCCTFC